jgi:uncharacterized membrane protein
MREFSALDVMAMVTALGCGLIAGVFFAFSTFVMRALAALPAAQGVATMQSINVAVINPWFMTTFVGTALICLFLGIAAFMHWGDPRAPYWLIGSLLYIAGTFLVTIVFNVPRNDALAAVTPAGPQAATFWLSYVSTWTAWNHVRMLAALAASASLILGVYLRE